MNITKDNFRTLVWDESISSDDYYTFYSILNFEEKVDFLKFILEKYPDFDKNWIEYYFNISDKWEQEGQWDELSAFADFVREKCPKVYKQHFAYLERSPVVYALFQNDLKTAKIRFSESVVQPEEAIDDSLRYVFNLLSTNLQYKDFAKEVAEKVWQPLANSNKLIGGADFNYSAYLYCDYLENAFDKIKAGETIDWEDFTQKVEAIGFKMVENYSLLPTLKVIFEEDKFHKNEAYRKEKLNDLLTLFLYSAYTNLGIPVYWAFRTWNDWRKFLVEDNNAPARTNWFAFTPKMIDRMGGKLHGFLGENITGMINVSMTLPYLYDFFLQQNYISESLYAQLMEYYDFYRREILKIGNQSLWKYHGLYSWKKPNFFTEDRFEQEKALMLDSINWQYKDSRKNILAHTDTLPVLPKSATPPPPEPSAWEKLLTTPIKPPSKKRQSNRPKKKRKKKHKDNRKRGKRKK